MKRIKEQEGEPASKAVQALMVLTFARRPLTVDELCYALAVDLDCPDDGVDEDNLYPIEYVKSCCAGLVAVQTSNVTFQTPTLEETSVPMALEHRPSGNNVVQLAHKSIRDYLSSPESKWFSQPQLKMSLICKAFIEDYEGSQQHTRKPYPFLSYAQDHWAPHHANAVLEAETEDHGIVSGRRVYSSSPLDHQAVFQFGFRQLAKELTDMRELFLWACREGRLNIIGLLLTISPDAFTRLQDAPKDPARLERKCGCSSCAAAGQDVDMFRRETAFTRAGYHEDDCTRTRSPSRMIDEGVVSAAYGGRIETIEFLLSHGATLDGRDADGFTPLGAASWAGNADALAWLLDLDLVGARDVQRTQFRSVPIKVMRTVPPRMTVFCQHHVPGRDTDYLDVYQTRFERTSSVRMG